MESNGTYLRLPPPFASVKIMIEADGVILICIMAFRDEN